MVLVVLRCYSWVKPLKFLFNKQARQKLDQKKELNLSSFFGLKIDSPACHKGTAYKSYDSLRT